MNFGTTTRRHSERKRLRDAESVLGYLVERVHIVESHTSADWKHDLGTGLGSGSSEIRLDAAVL